MWKEFRTFIVRGNVMDLAVGIVIGAAFTSVVNSFVNDILMPPIGLLKGGVNFTELFVSLDGVDYESLALAQAAGAPTINYGLFINNIISFMIVGVAVFLLVQSINRLRAQKPVVPPAQTEKACPHCLLNIPLAASRCPHCTSQLVDATDA